MTNSAAKMQTKMTDRRANDFGGKVSFVIIAVFFYLSLPLFWLYLLTESESGAYPVNADSIGLPFFGGICIWIFCAPFYAGLMIFAVKRRIKNNRNKG